MINVYQFLSTKRFREFVTNVVSAEIIPIAISEVTTWRHLMLHDTDGLTGVGEFTTEGASEDLDQLVNLAASHVIGINTETPDYREISKDLGGDSAAWTAVSAIDQAWQDLQAQRRGISLSAHWCTNKPRTQIALYANINRRTIDRSPAVFVAGAEAAVTQGYSRVKVAPFDGLNPRICGTARGEQLIQAGLERVVEVSERLAGRAALMVDCHWRFDFGSARAVLSRLADAGVVWLECPIPETTETIGELCRLREMCAALGIRLAGCETMNGLDGFIPFIEAAAYDVIMPDVKYVGGIEETRRIVHAARAHGIACSLHNPSGPVAHLHSVHACAALGLYEPLEVQFDESPKFFEIVEPAPVLVNGTALVPQLAGLGARLNV